MAVPLSVVTVERSLFEGDVDFMICRGADGELGVLPQHAPLMTTLKPGMVLVRQRGEQTLLFVSGGFLEVLPHRVTILADSGERAADIDPQRAEDARRRAEMMLAEHEALGSDVEAWRRALERAEGRLRAVDSFRRGQA